MQILDKLDKLKSKMLDFRGEVDTTTEKSIKIWHQQIREEQSLVDLLGTPGMKQLVKEAKKKLALINNSITPYNEENPKLIARKEAWTDILQLLAGSPSRLRALEEQIDYELE